MRGALIKIFGLPSTATAKEIIAAARRCAAIASDAAEKSEEQATINRIIQDSCGALNDKSARAVMKNRAAFSASQRKRKT